MRAKKGNAQANVQRYHEAAEATLMRLTSGIIKVLIGKELPLSEAAEAHRLLESGKTTGSILLRT
ncbi:MAG: zinc-binding dehydrogenase [Leptospirales bacterium]